MSHGDRSKISFSQTATASFGPQYKGKNDTFTVGFMNFMYTDNSLFAATRISKLNHLRLEKLKTIE